ncbi:phospholipid-transporting ATPase Dnf1p [[Candida] anglica]|uniref:P-type phospholipid transporter n=1 Tax=[Candida] anglica TaxID=148631 RepID=A0ABP0EKN5_9ASCO
MDHSRSPFSDNHRASGDGIASPADSDEMPDFTTPEQDVPPQHSSQHTRSEHHNQRAFAGVARARQSVDAGFMSGGSPGSPSHEHSFSNSEFSDTESFASALPTPNLNVDNKKFDFIRSKQPSLRFKLPPQSSVPTSPVPTPPTSSSTSSVSLLRSSVSKHDKRTSAMTSPFMDSNTIVEDNEPAPRSQPPTSPFADQSDRDDNFYEVVQYEPHDVQIQDNKIDEDIESQFSEDSGDEQDQQKMKRHRWGTTRNKKGRPKPEAVNRSKTLKKLLNPTGSSSSRSKSKKGSTSTRRHETNNDITAENNETSDSENEEPLEANDKRHDKRSIVFNRVLPEEFLDPETGKPNTDYPRNKIRTTKYTPLSFLPKNIFNQFSNNVANIYFLVMIILGAFDIFGVPSPVMAAVPLIVIVIITAFKDAIEDSRRTGTDMEVNNQFTHILDNVEKPSEATHGTYVYENRNVNDETVSLWRKFKKWNTKQLFRFIGASKRNLTKEGRAKKLQAKRKETMENLEESRKSFDSTHQRYSTENPFDNETVRKSLQRSRKSTASRRPLEKKLKFAKKYWKDVRVGDVLRIYNNDEIPADVIILATSDDDNCCYVETKNLDGETNLKVRQALKYGHGITKADDMISHDFEIKSEGPHANLYSYQASLNYNDRETNEELQEPVTINNILLRGCSLRNTKWVIGVVAYTGDDTKIMLNSGITPTKQSRISRELNVYIYYNFALLFVICFVSGVINGMWYRQTGTSRDFYEFGTIAGSPWKNGLVGFFVALILYQSLVPISLYITIEIIKTAQAFFIFSDVGMYYERLDYPCTPKSWSISDDLGQIEYIFSDKTGTLTQNVMEFKKCTINGISYGKAYTEALAGLRKRQGIDVEAEGAQQREMIAKDRVAMIEKLRSISDSAQLYEDELSFISSEFVDHLIDGGIQKDCNEHFMLALALCHSVVTEEDPKNPQKVALKAQSPDEEALVGTARAIGFGFNGSTKRGLLVNIQGETKEYQVLNTLEFNSTRKRMSAIIKIPASQPEDEPTALLICKGADSIIYERLSKKHNNPELLESTAKHLEEYAVEGLRTLCIAQRELTWSQYTEWNNKHVEAASSLDKREERMEEVADSIERELILLGGTAIEDRLQDGVPDAIALLGEAGIKLWVLTGDKVETAINIGFSCNLLGNDMELLILKTTLEQSERDKYGVSDKMTDAEIVDMLISKYLSLYFHMDGSFEELEEAKEDHSPPNPGFGVVIDGDALKVALLDPETRRKFLLLCKQCKAVLCCRVSPAQKAAVVKLVKDTLDVMTLAIGDGSNDVAMIQAADVGVGIAGEEGRQAVMSSDYAIGQFRFLAKLLLAHGRWSYKRFSEMIPSFFYKNVIFNIALFWYGVYNNFDGSYLFEFTFLMFYSLAFSSLPVIFLGVMDQDVSGSVSLLVPQLYRTGIIRSEWTQSKFWIYMVDGIYQSAISFFFPYLLYHKGFCGMNGLPIDHRFWMGVMVTAIACISCNFYILFHQYRWDWLSTFIVLLSIFLIYFWTLVWSSVVTSALEFYDAGVQIMQSANFWAITSIGVLICLAPRFCYDICQKIFWPKDIDIIRECVNRGDFDAYPIDYDPTDPNRVKISKYSADAVDSMRKPQQHASFKKDMTPSTDSDLERQSSQYGLSSAVVEPKPQRVTHPLGGGGSPDVNGIPKDVPSESIVHRKPANNESQSSTSPKKRKSIFDRLKRESNVRSFYDNGSLIDTYNFSNGTQDDLSKVQTEEIPMEDFKFEENQRNMSRISGENDRRRSHDTRYAERRMRTSLDLPELSTTNSLVSRVSGEYTR